MGRKSTRRETSANWGLWPVVGIGTPTPIYADAHSNPIALDIESGGVYINGVGTGLSGLFYGSDKIFKTNIDSIPNAVSIISQLKPRSFYFDTANIYGLHFNGGKQYGLIAQDVEPILPELVGAITKPATYDSTGTVITPAITYKTLNYNAFIAIMLKGMQEQQAQIKAKDSVNKTLNNRIDSLVNVYKSGYDTLKAMINNCCNQNQDDKSLHQSNVVNQNNIILANNAVLYQNAPNPFGDGTTIKYFIPDNADAEIVFYDNYGNQIKTYKIAENGMGQINIDASNLSAGMYSYSLFVNGKVIDTKKMVRN